MSTSEITYDETAKAEIEQLLIGRKVTKVADDTLLLDDGRKLRFVGNDGGCACPSGCYDLTELNGVDNVITKVEFVDDPDENEYRPESGSYRIFVFADNRKVNLAAFEGTDGNGYYGTGYQIHVLVPEEPTIEPAIEKPHPAGEGVQRIYRFDNGYGASVVRFLIKGYSSLPVGSYGAESGRWELAVLRFTGEGVEPGAWDLTYETPVADDVLGHLDDDEVQATLRKIRDLPEVASRG